MKSRVNTLFTSAGRRVELLRAFREAYKALRIGGDIIALDADPLAPALRAATRPYVTEKRTDPRFIPSLIELCKREKPDLIFPLADPDIPLLAAHRRELEATGAKVVVVDSKAVGICRDKWETFRFFKSEGIPTPDSWLPGQLDPANIKYPVFIKPRDGSAGKDAHKIDSRDEYEFFIKRVSDPVVQECLEGPELTSDVICGLDGRMLAVVSRMRIEVRSGEVSKGVTVFDREVTDYCVRIAKALPAIGQVTVQCLRKDGAPSFTEINPRFGGGAPLGIAAGADSPKWLLAEAAGMRVEIPPPGSFKTGLYLTRYDDSFFSTDSENAAFPRAGV